MLFVMAIIIIMTALLVPSISGYTSTTNRRAAVNILMNTFEQARVAALESGQKVRVAFADSNFPEVEMRYAAFMVFRDATDEERDPAGDGSNNGPPYVILKKWTKLPKNISIKTNFGMGNIKTIASDPQTFTGLSALLPLAVQDESLPVLTFNSSGVIEGGSNPLQLFLYEGYYLNGQDNYTRNATVQSGVGGLFERITFSRYTGRSQLDITATQ